MIKAYFTGGKVISGSGDAFTSYEKSRFGEKVGGRIEYSFLESLYLIRSGKMEVFMRDGKKKIDFDSLIQKVRRSDKQIEAKYCVFDDLRKRGYIIKTALKFGADFRVYEKGVRPGEDHARWIVFVVKENEGLKWHEFAAKNRIAHSTKKNLLLGIVDEEGAVSYYECNWKRL